MGGGRIRCRRERLTDEVAMDGRRARAVLGVSDLASADEIRRAFRYRALETHPDHGGDRAAFELAVLAFETLCNVEVLPAPRRHVEVPSVSDARPRFCAYDSRLRPPARRRFADVLAVALAREAHLPR
jgi:hypothetical protein